MSEKSEQYRINVIREAGNCPTVGTCFVLGTVPGRPGKVQAIAQIPTDPALAKAYRHRIGPGEILVEFDAADILGGV